MFQKSNQRMLGLKDSQNALANILQRSSQSIRGGFYSGPNQTVNDLFVMNHIAKKVKPNMCIDIRRIQKQFISYSNGKISDKKYFEELSKFSKKYGIKSNTLKNVRKTLSTKTRNMNKKNVASLKQIFNTNITKPNRVKKTQNKISFSDLFKMKRGKSRR